MKKIISLFLTALCLMSLLTITVSAKSEPVRHVYVTIADEKGNLVLTAKPVEHLEGMTLDDALRAAHKSYHKSGDAAYATENTAYGISMTKLWGVENGGAYGYMVNNASPASLADNVAPGDHIYAYVYTDTAAFSDTYSFFDKISASADQNGEVTLTLTKSGFDENFAPKNEPVEGAVITINGEKTDFVTDKNGNVTLSYEKAGTHVISAEAEGMTLVPPVCLFTTPGITYVSLSDETGKLVLAYEPIFVTDKDRDGILSIHDALTIAHEKAALGEYRAELDAYGDLTVTSLLGVSGRKYGCYIDGSLVYRLAEPLSEENHIQAFIYTDNEAFSDKFTYFSKETLTFENGKEELTLFAYGVADSGHFVSEAVSSASITVNGKEIGVKTDKNGKFTLSAKDLTPDMTNIISAVSDKTAIVPPILAVSAETIANAGKMSAPVILWLFVIVILGATVVFTVRAIMYNKKRK